jgi:Asp-tRNA(Asn)/Glu-tRNA(Gln) amidotransferase C subunit
MTADELDTSEFRPWPTPCPGHPFREDECGVAGTGRALANAPSSDGAFFIVPKVNKVVS